MARRGIPKRQPNWYLREWMAAMGIKKQSEMMKRTGWSKATMSQLYNYKQDYSPAILEQAAVALGAERWELLMPPANAMALRGFRETAREVARIDEPDTHTGTRG
jgi:transcriptional regulator with XRE-family HTH domain